MNSIYDIIKKPIVTERSMEGTQDKKYTFAVVPTANKLEIKQAVEKIFGVSWKRWVWKIVRCLVLSPHSSRRMHI